MLKKYSVKKDYYIHETLGEGSYGIVRKAQLRTDATKKVAIKFYEIDMVDGFDASNVKEISILKSIKHPNIIQIINVYIWKKRNIGWQMAVVMPLIRYTLESWISQYKYLPNKDYFVIMEDLLRQIIVGLYHIHSSGFVHQDLKTANILVTESGIVKIIDFGMSVFNGNYRNKLVSPTGAIQSLFYRSPELLQHNIKYEYDSSTDIWALGCIFVELLDRGTVLFQEYNNDDMLNQIMSGDKLATIYSKFSEYSSILKKMLVIDYTRRSRIDKIAYMAGISSSQIQPIRKNNIRLLTSSQRPIILLANTEHRIASLNFMLSYSICVGYSFRTFVNSIYLYDLCHSSKYSAVQLHHIALACMYIAIGICEPAQVTINSIMVFLDDKPEFYCTSSKMIQYIASVIKKLQFNIHFVIPTDFITKVTPMHECLTLISLYNSDYGVYMSKDLITAIDGVTNNNINNSDASEFLLSSISNILDMDKYELFGPKVVYHKAFNTLFENS